MILGTAADTAPEQARGRAVDKRADVWAFGAVLFEMLTGARAFPGDDLTDTLAAVVRGEPNWTLLPPGLPPTLVVYLKRCLHKDPKQRIPDMAAMRLALEGAFATWTCPQTTTLTPQRPTHSAHWCGSSAAIAVVSLAVAAFTLWNSTCGRSTDLDPADHPALDRLGNHIGSGHHRRRPDGGLRRASGGRRIRSSHLCDRNSFETRAVAGSKGARQPFFSPDGKWVAFFAQSQLQKAEVAGGAPVRIVEVAYPFGGSWTEDNTIIYAASLGSGLLQIPASGGAPKVHFQA